MAEDQTAAILRLQDALTKAQAESIARKDRIQRMKAEAENAAKALAERDEQIKKLAAERDSLAANFEELQKQASAPPDAKVAALLSEVDALKGEIRTGKHKQKFADLATKAGVRPEAIDDVWTLSGYKPEGDEIDEKHIGEMIGGILKDKPYFAGSASGQAAPDGGQAQPSFGVRPPGPGARGVMPSTSTNPVLGVTEAVQAAIAKRGGNPFKIA